MVTTTKEAADKQPQAFPIKLSHDILQRISRSSSSSIALSPSGLPSALIIDEERFELFCTEEHQQLDLLDLQVGEFVKTGLKHKLTVKSELAESQRQVIRNEHERAIKEKSTRTIKTLTPMTGSSTQKRTITQKKALIAEQAVKEAQSIQIEMNLQNRLVHLLILKPLTLTLLCQRLKASSTNLQPLLDTKESVRLIKPRAWPHYSARERQIVADNLLKLQMTGDYGLPTLQPQESGMERSSTSSYSGVKKPSVNGVKGRIQKVISRIRK